MFGVIGQAKRQVPVELASIAGLIGIFAFLELTLAPFSRLVGAVSGAIPLAREYGFTITVGMWVGLAVYSAKRRLDLSREIRARESLESDYELVRIIDKTTGLPNRLGFENVVLDAFRAHGRDAVTLAGFEVVNLESVRSAHGEKAGQIVESIVADRLVREFRGADFIARGDGLAFYAVLVGGDAAERDARFNSYRESFADLARESLIVGGFKVRLVPASAAFAADESFSKSNDLSVDELLRRLHFALRQARNAPGRIVYFDAAMEENLRKRTFVEANLESAVRNGEIVPYFQPFIDLESNRVIGFEVLARWEHPTAGIQMPGLFIPIAEDMGLLGTVTLSILKQACAAATSWLGDMRLAINISPPDLSDTILMRRFVALIHEAGIRPEQIEIEVTENAFIEEESGISEALVELKKAGIKISIDDFGTGYASLHHLRILPFDKIKIDQSFVKDMLTNPESRSIVEAIIALAESLGLPTTAEGIEGDDYRQVLHELGCTIGQGYLFAKPLPASAVAPFLDNFRAAAQGKTIAA